MTRFMRSPKRLLAVMAGCLALVLLPSLSAHAAARAADVNEVVAKLQETCTKTRDLSAQFHQTATNRSLGQVQEADGRFLMKRPGKMRWEYQKPEERLFVTDGKTLWIYTPADKQVLVQDVGAAFSSRVPLSFLAGDCNLRRDFSIAPLENAATRGGTNAAVLDLKPLHPEAGIARLLLEVNRQNWTVEKTTVFDAAGNTTVIALSDLKLNTGIPDQQFEFTPPPGVKAVTPPKQ